MRARFADSVAKKLPSTHPKKGCETPPLCLTVLLCTPAPSVPDRSFHAHFALLTPKRKERKFPWLDPSMFHVYSGNLDESGRMIYPWYIIRLENRHPPQGGDVHFEVGIYRSFFLPYLCFIALLNYGILRSAKWYPQAGSTLFWRCYVIFLEGLVVHYLA